MYATTNTAASIPYTWHICVCTGILPANAACNSQTGDCVLKSALSSNMGSKNRPTFSFLHASPSLGSRKRLFLRSKSALKRLTAILVSPRDFFTTPSHDASEFHTKFADLQILRSIFFERVSREGRLTLQQVVVDSEILLLLLLHVVPWTNSNKKVTVYN